MAHRLLLIEDVRPSGPELAEALRALGWEVTRRTSGSDGLALAARDRPDAVVADVVLPGVDGATLAATLRLAPGRRVPFVLLTGVDATAPPPSCGADAVFTRPVSAEVLDACLRRALVAGAEPGAPALPGPVRVPEAPVLGAAPGGAGAWAGGLEPGWLRALLARLYDRRADGVLDVVTPDGRDRVFLHRGVPAASRSSEGGTELGKVLERLGVLSGPRIEAAVAEARRNGRPLADELVATAQVGRAAAERALCEQIVERLLRLDARGEGRWSFEPSDPVGLPGYEAPLGAVWVRLGAGVEGAPLPRDRHVRWSAPAWAWALVDPEGAHASLHAAIMRGDTVAACAATDPVADAWLGVFRRFGMIALVDGAEAGRRRAPGPPADLARIEADLASRAHALGDADHYTVLGVAPDASAAEVHAANVARALASDPDRLPARERAQGLFAAVLEAGRVLTDPDRRVIYDQLLARRGGARPAAGATADHGVLLAERGRQCFRRGEYVTAAGLLRHAAHQEPDDADLLAMLGRTRRLACPDDPAAGEPELRRAVTLDPTADFPRYWLARLHHERGDHEAARHLLREILTQNPEFEPAREAMRLYLP